MEIENIGKNLPIPKQSDLKPPKAVHIPQGKMERAQGGPPLIAKSDHLPLVQKLLNPADSPSLSSPATELAANIEDLILTLIQDNELPTGKDLEDNLSKEFQAILNQMTDSLENKEQTQVKQEMKSFFTLLSRLYPLSLSLTQKTLPPSKPAENVLQKSLDSINDIKNLMEQNTESLNLPPETQALLKKTLSELPALSPTALKQALKNLDAQGAPTKPLANNLAVLSTLQNLSPQEQKAALSSFNIRETSTDAPLFDPQIEEFSTNIGKFIQGIVDNNKTESKITDKSLLYAIGFKQSLLSGAVFGKMLVEREIQKEAEPINLTALKFQASKELGILDQIPFSFLAFFPDIRNYDEKDSEAIKEAKKALLQLIRILLQLVFILSALSSAEKKIGRKGMEKILLETAPFISSILDNLIFALKKVDEHYVINVNFQIARAEAAKEALNAKNSSQFWKSALSLFTVKTELASFLESLEEATPLFETIKSLVREEKPFSADIPM